MKRLKIAQYIALGATICTIVGICLGGATGDGVGEVLMYLGFIAGLVSYIFGGFGTALRMAGKIAKWGWLVVPFPYDLASGGLSFFVAIAVFICLPIIPVRKAYLESL